MKLYRIKHGKITFVCPEQTEDSEEAIIVAKRL